MSAFWAFFSRLHYVYRIACVHKNILKCFFKKTKIVYSIFCIIDLKEREWAIGGWMTGYRGADFLRRSRHSFPEECRHRRRLACRVPSGSWPLPCVFRAKLVGIEPGGQVHSKEEAPHPRTSARRGSSSTAAARTSRPNGLCVVSQAALGSASACAWHK